MKNLLLDTSTAINAKKLIFDGYITFITPEIKDEIRIHVPQLLTNTTSYRVESSAPRIADFTQVHKDNNIQILELPTSSGIFRAYIVEESKSSRISFCGNSNHKTRLTINSPSNQDYNICQGVYGKAGDLSNIMTLIFDTDKFYEVKTDDICLGRIQKRIIKIKNAIER